MRTTAGAQNHPAMKAGCVRRARMQRTNSSPALIKEYLSIIRRSEMPASSKPALYAKTLWKFSQIKRKTLKHYIKQDKLMPLRELSYLAGSVFKRAKTR